MDHAEATKSEGHVRTNVVGDNPRLRGNDTKPTSELMVDVLESYVRQSLLSMPKTPPLFILLDVKSRHSDVHERREQRVAQLPREYP